jgi:8-hydroxy-5-deazaflavin:NADPH oxidoreductase
MKVGILGSGLMGAKIGTIFARAGHDVVFSYSRRDDKLRELARSAGPRARAGTPREAAENADALLLAVHWSRVEDVLRQAGDVSGKVVITCSLPMNASDTGLVVAHTSSGAETLAKKVPGSDVVAAFQTVPSEVLFDVFEARDRKPRPSLVYCGDSDEAKRVAATLIQDAGFDAVDAGPLRVARYTEPFALLMGQLAYEGEEGPEVAYRFERYGTS